MFNVAPVVAIWLAWFFVAANVVGTKFATPYAASTLFMQNIPHTGGKHYWPKKFGPNVY